MRITYHEYKELVQAHENFIESLPSFKTPKISEDVRKSIDTNIRLALDTTLSKVTILIDRDKLCVCDAPNHIVINHSLMWHDGDIICHNCGGYVREFDAG